MDLLLWRHAEAVAGSPDHERVLSTRGEEQARRMARWLARHGPQGLRVLASPAARTCQTAAAFTRDFVQVPVLSPGGGAHDLLVASGWPVAERPCLLVGHQPALGRLAALLLTGVEADWSVRKGALWWFRCRERGGARETVLRAVVAPELV
ncbi:MAG: histidine phosphatase family protein [Gammaproteobacteria bacterium]|nr:histidine phosphatase family protein [Gammaproteobacteria bacterium]